MQSTVHKLSIRCWMTFRCQSRRVSLNPCHEWRVSANLAEFSSECFNASLRCLVRDLSVSQRRAVAPLTFPWNHPVSDQLSSTSSTSALMADSLSALKIPSMSLPCYMAHTRNRHTSLCAFANKCCHSSRLSVQCTQCCTLARFVFACPLGTHSLIWWSASPSGCNSRRVSLSVGSAGSASVKADPYTLGPEASSAMLLAFGWNSADVSSLPSSDPRALLS